MSDIGDWLHGMTSESRGWVPYGAELKLREGSSFQLGQLTISNVRVTGCCAAEAQPAAPRGLEIGYSVASAFDLANLEFTCPRIPLNSIIRRRDEWERRTGQSESPCVIIIPPLRC